MTADAPANIRVLEGDLFTSDAQTLVNTVNTVGVMGKGVALGFKKRFPDMFADYQVRCSRGEVRLGEPYLFRRLVPPNILNFPTKEHWRSVSRLEDIARGLDVLERRYRQWGIESLAVPPLGCGQGGLEWRVVGPELHRHLARLEIPVALYAPFGAPHDELTPEYLDRSTDEEHDLAHPPRIPPAWIGLVDVLSRLERNPHRFYRRIGRTTFQKLAYFATVAGLPTDLRFARGSYGPFAKDMKAVQSKLVNNGLIHETPSSNLIAYSVGPTFEPAARAFRRELGEWSDITVAVARLLATMTTHEAEVAATVHFAAEQLRTRFNDPPTELQVLHAVMAWKARRRPPLTECEVARSIRDLALLGWIGVRTSEDLPYEDLAEAAF